MKKITLADHKLMVQNDDSTFMFKGSISVALVDYILEITHAKLESFEENPNLRRKVYLVLVECLQNLCKQIENLNKHEIKNEDYDITAASFFIESDGSCYKIATANFVANDKVDNFRSWLEEINSYNRDELKLVYNKILTNKHYSNQGGAGLGFIDIALKTKNKLEFTFEKIDENFTFFNINTLINK